MFQRQLSSSSGAMATKILLSIFIMAFLCFTLSEILYTEKEAETLNGRSVCPDEISTAPRTIPEETDIVSFPIRDLMSRPAHVDQSNPALVKIIRNEYLIAPSTKPYNLEKKDEDPSQGQTKHIKSLLKNKKNGFFIECGALDGELRSNSLAFERDFGWSGVMIEADPDNFKLVQKKERKAWTISACLSIVPYPTEVIFKQNFNMGKISSEHLGEKLEKNQVPVQCLPLYSILLSMNRTTVDYFSLDVEGNELDVLQTIPWDKVNITTLSVEFEHVKQGKSELRKYMEGKGYVMYKENWQGGYYNDFIFYHPLLLDENKQVS